MPSGTLLAAVDLGSNSFRLEIGRLDHGQIQRVEYLKETVRQGSGLDECGPQWGPAIHLSRPSCARGTTTLRGGKR
jgi:exopolyphosphatase/guanosine-5'-triphosphate,3'-diphosphate pyrophosphatase